MAPTDGVKSYGFFTILKARKLTTRCLLPHQADHCRAAIDHIEFTCRSTTQIDNTAPAIRATINNPHNYRFSVANIGHHHFGAKWQCPMSSSETGWSGYLAACGVTAAIESGHAAFSVSRADRNGR